MVLGSEEGTKISDGKSSPAHATNGVLKRAPKRASTTFPTIFARTPVDLDADEPSFSHILKKQLARSQKIKAKSRATLEQRTKHWDILAYNS
jgi:hypothetical protein